MNAAFRRCRSLYRFSANVCQYGTKIQVEIDPTVQRKIKSYSNAKHDGQTHNRKVLRLPPDIEDAIKIAIKEENHKHLLTNGYSFLRHLHARQVPLEEYEKELLAKTEELKTAKKLAEKQEVMHPHAFAKYEEKASSMTLQKRKGRENLWTPTSYDDQKCFQYLLLRGPANYAVLKVILSEIASRDPDFQPKSVMDFGSGVGTVSWVIEQLWKSCKEFYNVDICSTMRDLAGLILKRGNPQCRLSPGIFFRGFLPSSLKYTHDIVVSAYTLLELPSRKQRLETLLTLWNKADSYLVVVEEGTLAGYKIVIEARDFILEMAENEQKNNNGTGAHVFSPCPHDRVCPKFLISRYPCNFEVYYSQHPSVQSEHVVRERYSYVVLKRGPRPTDKLSWPRIVEEMKVRHKHIMCRLCTAEGALSRVTLSHRTKDAYTILKNSLWGDTLPFSLSEYEDDRLSRKELGRLDQLQKSRKEENATRDLTSEGEGQEKHEECDSEIHFESEMVRDKYDEERNR